MSESKEAGLPQQKAIIPIGSRGIELSSFDELYRFSQFVIKANLAPPSIDTPEKVFLAIQYSMEMGFSPMTGLQNAMVINNRVAFFGELVAAQVQAHPEFENMEVVYQGESGPELTCVVTIKRKGMSPSVGTFSIREAQHLINDPSKAKTWGRYPRRMLFWRAFSRAKVIFSDALKGIEMPSDFDETPKDANVLSITKPKFEHEKATVTGDALDRTPGHQQLSRESGAAGGSPAEVAKEEDGKRPLGAEVPAKTTDPADLPGHPETGEPPLKPEPKAKDASLNKKAERVLRLINNNGFSQTQVIDLLKEFEADTGEAKESGVVADLPEQTLDAVLQQWETVKFNLAK